MKSKLHLGRGAAILACTASLGGTAIVLAPVTPAAAATNCGNKMIKIPQEGGKAYPYPVKSVEVEGGASCSEAVKVITSFLSGKPISGWKGVSPHFELSKSLQEEGFLPMEIKKGSKKIKYGGHGG